MEKKLELEKERYQRLLKMAVATNDFLLEKVHEEAKDGTEALSFAHEIICRLVASHCMAISENSEHIDEHILTSIVNRVQSIFRKKKKLKNIN